MKLGLSKQDFQSKATYPEAEFKEFERRLKFKPRLKYGRFHLKFYLMLQDLSRCLIETGFWWIKDAAQIL